MKNYYYLMTKERPIHNGDYFSFKHPPMKRSQRAKLFMAFDALSGFGEAIYQTKEAFNNKD